MKRVLIAPLDWGLGHATRCIPIIRLLDSWKVEVHIAGSGPSLDLLAREFPFIPCWELPGYSPRYPTGAGMAGRMARQLPRFLRVIEREHQRVEELVREHGFDVVISDNRFGCWTSLAHTVFMTHQSNIMMPRRFGWLAPIVRWLNQRYAKRFDACWIPDYPDDNSLAGSLISFGKGRFHRNVRYIGPLSRFSASGDHHSIRYDVVAVCSGPEPQRTLLEDLLRNQLEKSGLQFLLVRGVISGVDGKQSGNGTVVNYLTSEEMQAALKSARLVVARSGFSTVMDLQVLGKKAVFIPTPGQTEQEYLAKKLMQERIAFAMPQDTFDLTKALAESENYQGFSVSPTNSHLQKVLAELISYEGISE